MKRVARALGGFIPFSALSRHKQRDAFIKLRGTIARTKDKYGPNFTSDLVLNEPGRPAIFNDWFHFYFLGLDGHTIWNTYLYSASHAYWEKISSLARDEANRLAPRNPEQEGNLQALLKPVYDASGRKLHYVMREQEPEAALGNKTRHEFMQDYESKLIKEDTGLTAPVFESFEIERAYQYGFGLRAIIDVPEITAETIEAMIAKFRAIGEQSWKNDTPVPHTHLPKDTQINLAGSLGLAEKGRAVEEGRSKKDIDQSLSELRDEWDQQN